jgi:exosome complex RNA-binding protein Rrp4
MNDMTAKSDEIGKTGKREIVLPGEVLAAKGLKSGPGTFQEKGQIFASTLGPASTCRTRTTT